MVSPAAGGLLISALCLVTVGLLSFASRSIAGSRTARRLGAGRPDAGSRRAWLEGPAAVLSKTRTGRAIETYRASVHPMVTFSDLIAWTLSSLVAGSLVGILIFGSSPLAVIVMVCGPVVLDRIGRGRSTRVLTKLEGQLPEALALQASSLRAGRSLLGSLEMVGERMSPPLGSEIRRLVDQVEMGVSLEQALRSLAARVSSRDVELWVTAMSVSRVTGGNLTTVLESLTSRVRERLQLRSEVRALTSQARLSGVVVGAAPIAFFVLLSVTSRQQMDAVFSTPLGMGLLAGGISMQMLGFLWIRRIMRVSI